MDDPINLFTGLLVVFTVVLAGGGIWTNVLTKRSVDSAIAQGKIATQEYVASHRPKLRIRMLRIDKLAIGKPITLQYEVLNFGDTKAKIITNEITLRVDWVRNNGNDPVTFGCQFHFADYIAQGEALSARKITPVIFEREWTSEPDVGGYWGCDRITISGVITYMDDNGTIRRTGFYRICTDNVNRFRLPDFDAATLADHEYQD